MAAYSTEEHLALIHVNDTHSAMNDYLILLDYCIALSVDIA